MAKHPHLLELKQNKTWRCMLPNCRYFIHRGLEHSLPGQTCVCWTCKELFEFTEDNLKQAMPTCGNCNLRDKGLPTADQLDDYFNAQDALARTGKKSVDELTPTQRNMLNTFGVKVDLLTPKVVELEVDQIEVIEADEVHAPDCEVYVTGECTCR